jgi:3'-5' exoribonuclease
VKKLHVADLKDGDAVTIQLLVREKEIRTSPRTGKSWLELSLSDRTGAIPAKMWDNFEPLFKTFDRDDIVQVRARVKLYNNQKELTLEQIIPVMEKEYDLSDFLPHTRLDVEKLYADLRAAVASMKNPWLQRLLTSIVDDPVLAAKLKSAPAAMTMHHAYLGGLLEHLVSLIGLSRAVAAHYPDLDPDLLLTGIVLHDIGKTDELRYSRAIDYSTEGRLLGHIAIGLLLVREKIKSIPNFPEPLAALVEHLILSHHGSHEFGSPALPQFPEAVVLHFLDDVDSKMASMRETFASSADPSAEWSDRNPSLRRALLRTGAYLGPAK